MKNLGIVGCGKMGQALAPGMAASTDARILCCDVSQSALDAMQACLGQRASYTTDVDEIAKQCDVVLTAVKPVHALGVIRHLGAGCAKSILSIVAGIKYDALKSVANGCDVVRIMPNTPALVGAGSMVILDNGLSSELKKLVENLFSKAGCCHFVQNEAMMDAVTGLSGSCPALFAMMAEALADAGVAEGLPRELARDLARETMRGTAELLAVQHPAVLKESVMSPGGTTAAGVLAAEKAGFRNAAAEFVRAASQRSREMG